MKSKFVTIVSLITTALFIYTAISKLVEIDVFREQIDISPVLYPIAGIIVWLLPAAEITTAGLLLFQKYRRIGLYASLVLMIAFTGYIVTLMNKDEKLPCSCGGFINALSTQQHLILNISLIFLLIGAILTQSKSESALIELTENLK